MVVDTSVLLAILLREPEAGRFSHALANSISRYISVASILEASIITQGRLSDEGIRDLDRLLDALRLVPMPVTETQMAIARQAQRIYGKGQGHRASLNYGDLFAYALAKDIDEPLLFKGNDFTHTDLHLAAY